MLASLICTVDTTIVTVALPHMQGSLQASQDQVAWIVTSFIVGNAVGTPLSGWLATRYGLRRVLLVSVMGFTVASMLCGLAENLLEIVLFRAAQGLLGASLVPLSQVALLQEHPRHLHARVTALWGMGVVVGPIIGPTIGGWLTDALSWRWAFYINAPIGLIAYAGILASMPRDHADRSRPFDLTGFLLLSVAIVLFQLVLDRGQTLDWFTSPEILAEAFFAAVAFIAFLMHTLTAAHPFIDLRMLRDRNFVTSMGLTLPTALSVMGPSVLLPLYLQTLQGYPAAAAGKLLAIRGIASGTAMILVGRMAGRFETRPLVAFGILISAFALWQMGDFTIYTPARDIGVICFLQGFGTPFIFVPMSLVAYATLRPEQRAEAGVTLMLIRNNYTSICVALTVAALVRSTQVNMSYLTEHFTPYSTGRWQELGISPGANAGTAVLLGEVERQAAAIGYANVFHWLAAFTIATLPLVLLFRTRRQSWRP